MCSAPLLSAFTRHFNWRHRQHRTWLSRLVTIISSSVVSQIHFLLYPLIIAIGSVIMNTKSNRDRVSRTVKRRLTTMGKNRRNKVRKIYLFITISSVKGQQCNYSENANKIQEKGMYYTCRAGDTLNALNAYLPFWPGVCSDARNICTSWVWSNSLELASIVLLNVDLRISSSGTL